MPLGRDPQLKIEPSLPKFYVGVIQKKQVVCDYV